MVVPGSAAFCGARSSRDTVQAEIFLVVRGEVFKVLPGQGTCSDKFQQFLTCPLLCRQVRY